MDPEAVYVCESITEDARRYGQPTILLRRCDGQSGYVFLEPSEPEPFAVGRKYRLVVVEVKDNG